MPEKAIHNGQAQVGDEGVPNHLTADPGRRDGSQYGTHRNEPAQWPQVMANQVARASMLSGGDQRIDDHHAGRGGDGDVHRRLPHRIVDRVMGHEHAVQQGHHDETTAKAKQHRSDASHAAKECQQEVGHIGLPWD